MFVYFAGACSMGIWLRLKEHATIEQWRYIFVSVYILLSMAPRNW